MAEELVNLDPAAARTWPWFRSAFGRSEGSAADRRGRQARVSGGWRPGRRWLGGGVLLPAVVTGLLVAGATWYQMQPEYGLETRLHYRLPAPDAVTEYRRMIRELQAPPESSMTEWPFGELLSIASVRFAPEAAGSTVKITVRTAEPQRAQQLAGQWIDERIATIGTSDTAGRIDAILAGLPDEDAVSEDELEEYRSAVAALGRLREPLRMHRQARAEKRAMLEGLLREPPPRGQVTLQQRQAARAGDIALQQDLRHLRARGEQVRRAVLAGLSAAAEAAARLSPARQALGWLIDDLRARDLETQLADVPNQVESFLKQFEEAAGELRDVLTGSAEGLDAVSLDEPQGLLDILDRLDATVGAWTDFSERELAAQAALVDGLSEGQATSVRRILVHNQLKRRLFTLETACEELSGRLGVLRRDWNFRLDALTGSVRGLGKRVQLQGHRIEERLQARADEQARLRRESEITRLEDEIRRIAQVEDQLREEFLGRFDVMMSSAGAAVSAEANTRRSLWNAALRADLTGALGDDLDGVELSGGDFVMAPEPLNTPERIRWCAMLGGGGGLACLLLLAGLGLGRRVLAGGWGEGDSGPIE